MRKCVDIIFIFVSVFSFFILSSLELMTNDQCDDPVHGKGICTPYSECTPATKAVREENRPHDLAQCGFDNFTQIVCCPVSLRSIIPGTTGPRIIRKAQEACNNYTNMELINLKHHILGGQDADIKDFPHMAALGFYKSSTKQYLFNCGGTLISKRHIVTAAHCIRNPDGFELKIVRLGVVEMPEFVEQTNSIQDYEVVNVTVHKDYTKNGQFNDIALVELAEDVVFTNKIRPACLYMKNNDPVELIVTGWGKVELNGNKSHNLQRANIRSVPLPKCLAKYRTRYDRNITENQICAFNEKSDTCGGDSGGPLQLLKNNSLAKLVGVTSYGEPCGSTYPGVYTRINGYLDWIESIVWP